MVLSAVKLIFGIQPLVQSALIFGSRGFHRRLWCDQAILGNFVIVPCSLVVSLSTMRIAAGGFGKPSFIRSDVWTFLCLIIVVSVILELLLSSMRCVPPTENLNDAEEEALLMWMSQSFGLMCASSIPVSQRFTPEAFSVLLAVRLMFVCLGVFIGESLVPVVLTGGIATGKSTVADMLRQSRSTADDEGSFCIVDTDKIAHDILLPPTMLKDKSKDYQVQHSDSVYDKVLLAFGEDILCDDDGIASIDRRKLGARIFADPSLRRTLNRLTHPRIITILLKQLLWGVFLGTEDICCADVPLLFESGQLRKLFSVCIVVTCTPEIQLQRLVKRNPDLTLQQCKDRIASQLSLEYKERHANILIINNGNLSNLKKEVELAKREVMARIYGVGLGLLRMLLLAGGSICLLISTRPSGQVFVSLETFESGGEL